jgi:hypothetical protein
MKITYEGKQAWRVAYEMVVGIPGLEAMTINGSPVTGREVGYKKVFANSVEEARQDATRRLYRIGRNLVKSIKFFNTERWHGERLEKKTLMADYQRYLEQRQSA